MMRCEDVRKELATPTDTRRRRIFGRAPESLSVLFHLGRPLGPS